MKRATALLLASLLVSQFASANNFNTGGDEFSFVFVDTAAPQDTLVVMADNYDQAVELYCLAQDVDRETVEKRFQIFDGGLIVNKSADPETELCVEGSCISLDQ